LLSYSQDKGSDSLEFDFLYPLLTYDRYGEQYRWQFWQLLSFAGGPTQKETDRDRFTLFPFYFQQRSSDPDQNYTAVVPFYGHLRNRLFRDEVFFVMLPFYVKSRKKDDVTENYFYPFYHIRHGPGLHGWQFWPFYGEEHKVVTTRTNRFGDLERVAGHDDFFVLWPFFFNAHNGIGTANPEWRQASLLAYSIQRSPKRDSTGVLWLFCHVNDREKKYREWQLPWPVVIFADGEGKTTRRIVPFFSLAHTPTLESDSWLWPVYHYTHFHSAPLDRERKRILYFLYSDLTEKNTETGSSRRKVDFLPFFSARRDYNGNTRLQVLTLLEPFTPGSHKIERDYSPLWALWRAEKNAKTGAASQSLLWNLYRHDSTPASQKTSAFFGLFQLQSEPQGKTVKLFYVPVAKPKKEKRE
jgi:hypothetical protein